MAIFALQKICPLGGGHLWWSRHCVPHGVLGERTAKRDETDIHLVQQSRVKLERIVFDFDPMLSNVKQRGRSSVGHKPGRAVLQRIQVNQDMLGQSVKRIPLKLKGVQGIQQVRYCVSGSVVGNVGAQLVFFHPHPSSIGNDGAAGLGCHQTTQGDTDVDKHALTPSLELTRNSFKQGLPLFKSILF